jgi:predicted nuclease with TOPRIM domain
VPNGERERFEVLLESVNSNLKLVAEGHGVLNEKFDRLDRKVDGIADDVSVLKTDVSVLKKDMRIVKDHLGLNGATPPAKARKASRKK